MELSTKPKLAPEGPAAPTNRLAEVVAELHALQAEIAASKAAFYAERERAQQAFAREQNECERRGQKLLHEYGVLKCGVSTRDGC